MNTLLVSFSLLCAGVIGGHGYNIESEPYGIYLQEPMECFIPASINGSPYVALTGREVTCSEIRQGGFYLSDIVVQQTRDGKITAKQQRIQAYLLVKYRVEMRVYVNGNEYVCPAGVQTKIELLMSNQVYTKAINGGEQVRYRAEYISLSVP